MAVVAAELLEGEFAGDAVAVANGHLKETAHILIDLHDILLGRIGLVDAPLQYRLGTRTAKKHGVGGKPIAPGTSGFLEICFGRVGDVRMDYATHIRLVDAHAESIRGYDDTEVSFLPGAGSFVFLLIGETGVVIRREDSVGRQPLGQFTRATAATYIDNGTTVDFLQELQDFLFHRSRVGTDAVGKVLALEAHADHVLATEMQLLLDIADDGWRRRGGKCQHGSVRQDLPHLGNAEVGRTEVVAPLGNAMGLIDRNKTDMHPPELGEKEVGRKAFGRDVEELEIAVDAILQRHDDLVARHSGIDRHGLDALATQVFHLIFHQSDEGTDDQA